MTGAVEPSTTICDVAEAAGQIADGFTLLITYLTDSRALLAEHAHSELVAITGEDHGKDVQRPSPRRHVSDAMRAWQDASETLRV